jgi:hypothetical protein
LSEEAASEPGLLVGWMTPNAIVRVHPETRAVFESLADGRWFDWSECLDEVAWSHGLDFEELVDRLHRAMLGAVS